MSTELHVEHFAVNVADPRAMADWYCEHLNMTVVRDGGAPGYVRFLADASGRVVMEIYCNPPDLVPDYKSVDPLVFHLAFSTGDIGATRQRLLDAGATEAVEPFSNPEGDSFAMLRDPWGLCVQLVKRATPML